MPFIPGQSRPANLESQVINRVALAELRRPGGLRSLWASTAKATFTTERLSQMSERSTNGVVFMPESMRNAESREPGITTADLADVNEPASTEQGRSQEQEFERGNWPRPEALDAGALRVEREAAPLFSPEESAEFHSRWNAIQVSFVDEPREAVQQADGLVASAMKRLAEIFAEERGHLDKQWDRGGDVSTEDLRIALRRYRSFFGRLLSV